MLKTVAIGKKINGLTQTTKLMVMSGDRIVLVDAATGKSPKNITTKIINKDLHIYETGAAEPSVVLNDYVTFQQSVQISGIDAGGSYINYATTEPGVMELGAAPAAAEATENGVSWGVIGLGALAVGGAAAALGGGGGGGSSAPVSTDTAAPTVTSFTISDHLLNQGETATVTITFSEAVKNLEIGDLVAENGTLSNLQSSGGGTTWTAIFTPADNVSDNANVIMLTGESYTDMAGNKGPSATSDSYAVDTTMLPDTLQPTLVITDNEPNVTGNKDGSNGDGTVDADGADILYTFTFDEPVNGFTASDITIEHGTAKTFTRVSDNVYTLGVTPEAEFEGEMRISVDAESYTDMSGNEGAADVLSAQWVDMKAPLFVSGAVDPVLRKIILTMDESVTNVTMADPGSFSVEINTKAMAVAALEMADNTVTLIMSGNFNDVQSIRVLYKDVSGDEAPAIQDLAGNDSTSFVYWKPDVTPPSVVDIFLDDPALSIGESTKVTIHFSEEVSDVKVSYENGTLTNLQSNAEDGSIWTATFTPKNGIEDFLNEIRLEAGYYHDLNKLANVDETAESYIIDTNSPAVMISDDESGTGNVAGGEIVYTFTFTEPVYGFSANDISVTRGAKGVFTGMDGDSVYTLVVTPEAGYEGNVTVDVAAGAAVDILGNPSTTAVQSVQTVDMKALAAPTFALKTDSGADDGDGITNVNGIDVTLDAAAAGWQYSLDGGTGWTNGNGTSFNLAIDALYAADDVQVRQIDAAGNLSAAAGNSDAMIVDKTAPRFSGMSSEGASGTITVTMDSVMNPASIAKENFTVTINGTVQTISAASVDGSDILLSVPSFSTGASIKVTYADISSSDDFAALQDLAGNSAVSFTQIQSVAGAPTATISLSDTALKIGETAAVTITFSEAVNGFDNSDIIVDGGILSTLTTSDNITWSGTFTPNADYEHAVNAITLTGPYTDTTGVPGSSATSANYTIDTLAPTLTISDDESGTGNIAGGSITYTFTFSEAVSGFTADDIIVSGGTKGAFSGSGSSYTLVVTPTAGLEGDMTVDIAASKVVDAAGNGNAAAVQSVQLVDMKAPTLVMTDDESGTGNIAGGPITYTFTFSEPMAGFSADDITVTNGAKGTFSGSGSVYTLVVTPAAGLEGDVTVSVPALGQVDEGGNAGTLVTSTQAVDMKAPAQLTLALHTDSGDIAVPAYAIDNITNDATVDVSGVEAGAMWEYSLNGGSAWITGSGSSFELASNTTYAVNSVQVRQTDSAGNISAVAGNAEAITVDTKAPVLTITDDEDMITANMDGSNADGSIDANGADVLYTFTFDTAVSGFDFSDIVISHGIGKTFTKVSDTEYTLGVTPQAGYEGNMSVSVQSDSYTDIAGNEGMLDTASTQAVDMAAPEFVSFVADASADSITLAYDSVLEAVSMSDISNFSYEINGTQYLDGTGILNVGMTPDGQHVTLTLTNNITAGDTVRIAYSDTVGDLANAVQDLAGNDATSLLGWQTTTAVL